MPLAAGSSGSELCYELVIVIGIYVYGYRFWTAKTAGQPSARLPDLDLRIVQAFIPGVVSFPESLEAVRPFRRFFRAGLALVAFGLFFFTSEDLLFLAWFLVILGLGSAIWMYFKSEPPDASAVDCANFQYDHLVVTQIDGHRDVFVLSRGVAFSIAVRRTPFGLLEKESQVKRGYSLTVTEGGRSVVLPLEFPGAGEFLAYWRKDGASVTFAEGTPEWFIDELNNLPSWRRGYFDKPPELPKQNDTLRCASCGSVDQYSNSREAPCCHFCSSSDLRKAQD